MQSRMPWLVVEMLSLLLSGLAGAQGYQWTEIVIPDVTFFQAFGLNDQGQTTVITSVGSGVYGNGTFTPLPPLEGFQVGAIGINNDGVITGRAFTVAGQDDQGFILRKSTYTLFSRPGWDTTNPRAIANSGLITGNTSNADGRTAGFVYDPVTQMFRDATPPGSDNNTITQGMNAFGRITGHGRDSVNGRYGFVWQQGTITMGKRELLPFFDRIKIDVSASTRGINDSGVVVGFISDIMGRSDGFVGSDALGYQRLVAPGGEMPGNSTICEGINNFAQVVCFVTDPKGATLGGFIGSPVKDDGNVETSSHQASTRDIAESSGAAEWTKQAE